MKRRFLYLPIIAGLIVPLRCSAKSFACACHSERFGKALSGLTRPSFVMTIGILSRVKLHIRQSKTRAILTNVPRLTSNSDCWSCARARTRHKHRLQIGSSTLLGRRRIKYMERRLLCTLRVQVLDPCICLDAGWVAP